MIKNIYKIKLFIFKICLASIIFNCTSASVEEKKIAHDKFSSYKEKFLKYHNSIGFEKKREDILYLHKGSDGDLNYFFENWDKYSYLTLNADQRKLIDTSEVIPRKYFEFSEMEWERKDSWENSMIKLVKKDFGSDPFLHKDIESKLRSKFAKKSYLVLGQKFDLKNYDLNREIYKLQVQVSDLLFSSESEKACKREYDLIDVPLKKSDAEKLRSLISNLYYHLRILPTPYIAEWTSESCIRPNQFAPRGCLQFKKEKFSAYVFRSQLVKVAFIGADDYTLGQNFKDEMPFAVYYNFEKKQPLVSCSK